MERIKIRLKFKKTGPMKFIGHLDVMRYFQKLIRRAGLDIAYTEGFHPHQIMSFANPLGVGITSEGEYADITMNSVTSSDDMIRALNNENVEGFEIVDAVRLPEGAANGMASVAIADYLIAFRDETDADMIFDVLDDFFAQPEINVEKRTKKGTKLMDIRGGIHRLEAGADGRLFMRVSAGSALNIRPEIVLSAIYSFAKKELRDFSYDITRLEQYDAAAIPLLGAGVRF